MKLTNNNFKLSKATKCMLATVVGAHRRSEVRRLMVETEHYANMKPVARAPRDAAK